MTSTEVEGVPVQRKKLSVRTTRLLLLAALLIGWEIIGRVLGRMFLPPPSSIVSAAVDLVSTGVIVDATAFSLMVFFSGYGLAILIALPLSLLMGRFKRIGDTLDVYLDIFNAMPRLALIPLIIVWFGLGFQAKMVMVFLVAVFPIIIATYAGVSNVDKGLMEAGRAFGSKESQLFTMVMLPASVPYIIAGLRLGAARGILGIIMAEFFTAATGLGGLIITYGNTFQVEKFFVAIVVLAGFGASMSETLKRLEKYFAPWRTSLQV
ncbi:MAG: ABC transporter permease [Nitrososphaerales archaeon]